MQNDTPAFPTAEQVADIKATAPLLKLNEVRAPGFYYAPTNTIEHQRMSYFDGNDWRFVGDSGIFSVRTLMGNLEVYGPLDFEKCLAMPPVDSWPSEGDEFTVFVEVRADDRGGFDGFVLNPTEPLANMLRHYGGDEMRMAEEYFGQDFLPEAEGTYRMKLRMYVDPAYEMSDGEWSDDDLGFEVLTVERLSFEPCTTPAMTQPA